jgi:hypothetical protein
VPKVLLEPRDRTSDGHAVFLHKACQLTATTDGESGLGIGLVTRELQTGHDAVNGAVEVGVFWIRHQSPLHVAHGFQPEAPALSVVPNQREY